MNSMGRMRLSPQMIERAIRSSKACIEKGTMDLESEVRFLKGMFPDCPEHKLRSVLQGHLDFEVDEESNLIC